MLDSIKAGKLYTVEREFIAYDYFFDSRGEVIVAIERVTRENIPKTFYWKFLTSTSVIVEVHEFNAMRFLKEAE